jgi:hypothetical protein
MHWLHENADVLAHEADEEGRMRYHLRIDRTRRGRLDARLARLSATEARVL